MLTEQVTDARAWTRSAIDRDDWTIKLSQEALAELQEVVAGMRSRPLPLFLRHPDHFTLPACRRLMSEVEDRLARGFGLVVVDRLPIEQWGLTDSTAVYWLLGRMMGPIVATKWDGTILYDVRDSGRKFGPGVRGSSTRIELSFHTDNGFGMALPDYVGLLCVNPAVTGGDSQFCSLYSVHNIMLADRPDLLERLYQPVYIDRQGEHATGAARVLEASMISYRDSRLRFRLVPNLVRRGYELMGEPMDGALVDALAFLQHTLSDDRLRVNFTIERGQLQYLNNLHCAHFRGAFDDTPTSKRHLIRSWYRLSGGLDYDGIDEAGLT